MRCSLIMQERNACLERARRKASGIDKMIAHSVRDKFTCRYDRMRNVADENLKTTRGANNYMHIQALELVLEKENKERQ